MLENSDLTEDRNPILPRRNGRFRIWESAKSTVWKELTIYVLNFLLKKFNFVCSSFLVYNKKDFASECELAIFALRVDNDFCVHGKFRSLLPFLPSTWTLSVVEKNTHIPPTPLHLGDCTTHQLTDLLVAWLIDCSRQVGVRDPDTVHSQTLSMFTSLRITDVGRGGKVWWWVMWDDDGRWCMVRHDEEWWGMMRDDDGWWVGWIDFKTRT